MILLDIRTIVFSNVLTDIVCILVILLLWHQSRKRFAGTGFWVFDYAFQTAALFLIILRGNIPDWMSMVLSNTLVIAGALLGYVGLERFVGKKSSQVHNYVLLAAFACVHSYFVFVQPNLAARSLNVSVGLLIICFQCMWLLLSRVEPGMRQLTLGVGIVFGVYCLVSIVRIVEFFIGTHAKSNYFQSGAFESLILISYQILFILLTYSLVLMFNKRLLVEVKTQEEKFSKAFHSSPYAITLTRLSDGQIIEVNDGFVNITGYSYSDLLGKTTVGLHFWDKEEDRLVTVNELSKIGKVQGREFQFRKKSGEMITGLFSAEIIPINNQEFVLSSISDITGRKHAEEALRESEEQYRSVLDNIEYGYFEVDIAGNFTFFNDSLCRILGYSRDETMGMNNRQYMDKENAQKVYQAFNRAYTTGEPYRSFDWEILRKDGTKRFVESSVSLLRDLKGERIGFRGIVRDITDRKFAEEALRRSEEEAKRLAQENAVMAEIGEIISSTLNIEEVYERFADEVLKIIPFDRIVINIINIEKNTVSNVYMAGKGIADRKVGEIYPLKGSGNVEMVRTNSSLLIQTEDFDEYQDRFPTLLSTFQAGFRSIMNVPLFSKGKIIGGVLLRFLKPYAYMDKDVRLAERVANQIAGAIANAQLFIERKRALEDGEQLILKLQKALTEVKQLSGLLPICASCKKIRDDKGYWGQIESYISDHSEAEFSHGICPDCMKKLYPDFADDKNSV
jgi:PAS domain S-box-containing protein